MAVVKQVTMETLAARIEAATGKKSKARQGVSLKIAQVLQPNINEMFFTPVLILGEGLEDVAYITSYMALKRIGGRSSADLDVISFRRMARGESSNRSPLQKSWKFRCLSSAMEILISAPHSTNAPTTRTRDSDC